MEDRENDGVYARKTQLVCAVKWDLEDSSLADRYNMQQDCGGSSSVRRALAPKGRCGGVLGPDLAARKSLSDRAFSLSSLSFGEAAS